MDHNAFASLKSVRDTGPIVSVKPKLVIFFFKNGAFFCFRFCFHLFGNRGGSTVG